MQLLPWDEYITSDTPDIAEKDSRLSPLRSRALGVSASTVHSFLMPALSVLALISKIA